MKDVNCAIYFGEEDVREDAEYIYGDFLPNGEIITTDPRWKKYKLETDTDNFYLYLQTALVHDGTTYKNDVVNLKIYRQTGEEQEECYDEMNTNIELARAVIRAMDTQKNKTIFIIEA